VVRPSYVLGGRAMEIVYNDQDLTAYIGRAVTVSNDAPVLLDRFLAHATEVDVDAVCDGREVLIGGIMEHIEQAGVHSGDSACCLPPHQLSAAVQGALRRQTEQLAMALGVVGLINIQFAIRGEEIFVLEVNPRASRTVPFVSKATGVPLARLAAECMMGRPLADQGVRERVPGYWSVKEAVFPFIKLPGVDTLLGPEMKSTGEVMGVGVSFGEAFAKAQLAAGMELPAAGRVFISVRDADKEEAQVLARALVRLGFEVTATRGTAKALCAADVPCQVVNKVLEGRPHIVDLIKNDEITLIINTTEGRQAIRDSVTIRTSALERRVAYTTTMAGAMAILAAIPERAPGRVNRLQDLHEEPGT
jgi:carbamoyl-phosphate synthase large subunit